MAKTDPVRVTVSTEDRRNAGGSETETIEIARAEWDAMTPADRSALCAQIADEEASNRFSWGWNIDDPDDYAQTEG